MALWTPWQAQRTRGRRTLSRRRSAGNQPRVCEQAALGFLNQRVGVPGSHQLKHLRDDAVGAVVTHGFWCDARLPHVACLGVGRRGHDVPGDSPRGEVVEARERARDGVRRQERGRDRGTEADARGGADDGAQHRDRVERHGALAATRQCRRHVALRVLRHRECVWHEHQVEATVLEEAGDVHIRAGAQPFLAGVRVTPGRRVALGWRVHHADEGELLKCGLRQARAPSLRPRRPLP